MNKIVRAALWITGVAVASGLGQWFSDQETAAVAADAGREAARDELTKLISEAKSSEDEEEEDDSESEEDEE